MGYLDESGLARYDDLIKNWVTFKSGTVDGVDPLLNWQKTFIAGAVTFSPLPVAPIDPTVNFTFTETEPVEGEKSPDNPSTITGVTQTKVTRCGKNLIRAHVTGSQIVNGVTFTVNDNGSVTATGTASNNAVFYYATATHNVQEKAGYQYVLSGCPAGGSNSTYYIRESTLQISDLGDGATATASVSNLASIRIVVMSGVTVSNLVFKPQLELGSTATAFEPYEGADYTVNLGGTYFGGSVDLSAGTLTVTWGSTVITGAEEWTRRSDSPSGLSTFNSGLGIPQNYMSNSPSASTRHCSHFVYSNIWSENTYTSWGIATNTLFTMSATGYPDATAFKTWLASEYSAGHPVTIFYKLNTPQTIQLSPTEILSLTQSSVYDPRVNTVYSDQVSVQVGYPKSPLATSTELTNAIVSLGGNI